LKCGSGAIGLFIDLIGIRYYPIQGLFFRGEAVDAALVAFVVADDHVPAGALFVGEGQHDRLFLLRVHFAFGHFA
jgi:hypothetical protein